MKTPELIMLQLKSLGPQSAKMLADRISITTMGIRQHLNSSNNVNLSVMKRPEPKWAAQLVTGR